MYKSAHSRVQVLTLCYQRNSVFQTQSDDEVSAKPKAHSVIEILFSGNNNQLAHTESYAKPDNRLIILCEAPERKYKRN